MVGAQGHAAGHLIQPAFDVIVAERRSFDAFDVFRRFVVGKQLHGTDTIATDGPQQVERIGAVGLEALRDAAANRLAVGQKIVEVVEHAVAFQRRAVETDRQRQRERTCLVRANPLGVVYEFCRSARRQIPRCHALSVGPYEQRAGTKPTPGHYQSASFASSSDVSGRACTSNWRP